jgi:hypothetical protein
VTTRLTLAVGLVYVVIYVLRCWRTRAGLDLTKASTCFLSGTGCFLGLTLIAREMIPGLESLPLPPEALVIAGLALVWIGVQFGIQLWRCSAGLHRLNPVSDGPTQEVTAPLPPRPSVLREECDVRTVEASSEAKI